MMLAEDEPLRDGLLRHAELRDLAREQIFEKELLPEPQRDRHAEALEAARCKSEVTLEQAFEFENRLVVERDEIHVRQAHARLAQAVGERLRREARIVLLACEALLLRGGDDPAVLHERSGAVVIERRDTDDAGRGRQNSV